MVYLTSRIRRYRDSVEYNPLLDMGKHVATVFECQGMGPPGCSDANLKVVGSPRAYLKKH